VVVFFERNFSYDYNVSFVFKLLEISNWGAHGLIVITLPPSPARIFVCFPPYWWRARLSLSFFSPHATSMPEHVFKVNSENYAKFKKEWILVGKRTIPFVRVSWLQTRGFSELLVFRRPSSTICIHRSLIPFANVELLSNAETKVWHDVYYSRWVYAVEDVDSVHILSIADEIAYFNITPQTITDALPLGNIVPRQTAGITTFWPTLPARGFMDVATKNAHLLPAMLAKFSTDCMIAEQYSLVFPKQVPAIYLTAAPTPMIKNSYKSIDGNPPVPVKELHLKRSSSLIYTPTYEEMSHVREGFATPPIPMFTLPYTGAETDRPHTPPPIKKPRPEPIITTSLWVFKTPEESLHRLLTLLLLDLDMTQHPLPTVQ